MKTKEIKGFKRLFEKNTGITLIALIVTIIVTLILAGVSIVTLTGENGIITRATEAKQKMEEAALREQQQLADIEAAMGGEEATSEGFDYTSLVNAPELKEGMIPITYNETKGEWEVADKSNPNKSWYDYDNKRWANICTVSDSINNDTEKAYRTADVGTTIPEEDMTTMFVWIPRYAYSIIDGYQTPNTETPKQTNDNPNKKIDIKFLVGNTNRDIDNNTYKTDYNPSTDIITVTEGQNVKKSTPMIVHPGFTYGNTQLTGFWIAKFEASGTRVDDGTTYAVGNHTLINGNLTKKNPETNTPVKILPNVISWRNLTIGESEYRCMQMANNTATYGWTNANTHLIKNSEWGAVAYLCYSKYGVVPSKNGAGVSNSGTWYDLYTGAGPLNGTTNDKSNYNYSDYSSNQAYNKPNGLLASTTGNIYGVYDMSGGANERVAAYLDNGNNSLNTYGKSDNGIKYFENGTLKSEYTNLWDKYEVGNEEKLATGNNKAITISENEKLSQGELWDINKTDEKYIQARWNLTKENFENMQNYKGIGVNEMTNTFSFYTSHLYLKKNEETQQNESATRWGWLVNVSTAVARASSTSTDENTAYSWNQDIVRIGHASIPFVCRGGVVNSGAGAGVLFSYSTDGSAYNNYGFRPAICP